MQTPEKASLYADVHPHDLISQATDKLDVLKTLLLAQDGGCSINLNHPTMNSGLYYLFGGITAELSFALNQLLEKE